MYRPQDVIVCFHPLHYLTLTLIVRHVFYVHPLALQVYLYILLLLYKSYINIYMLITLLCKYFVLLSSSLRLHLPNNTFLFSFLSPFFLLFFSIHYFDYFLSIILPFLRTRKFRAEILLRSCRRSLGVSFLISIPSDTAYASNVMASSAAAPASDTLDARRFDSGCCSCSDDEDVGGGEEALAFSCCSLLDGGVDAELVAVVVFVVVVVVVEIVEVAGAVTLLEEVFISDSGATVSGTLDTAVG